MTFQDHENNGQVLVNLNTVAFRVKCSSIGLKIPGTGDRAIVTSDLSLFFAVEMSHDMTNQQNECSPSEDSDQPGHPPSLIRVFAVRMKKPWVLSYPLSAQQRLIRLGGCPG